MRATPLGLGDHAVLRLKPLLSVVALAFVARIIAQALLGAYAHPQTWEYEDIANSLLNGHGYTYVLRGTPYVAALASPLYVLVTVGVYMPTGHSQAVLLVLQALFGGATAALAGWLAAHVFRPDAASAAGVLVAVDPALLVFSAELHPLTLDALAFLALICACVWLSVRPTWPTAGLVGLLLGLAALTRTTILSLVPIMLVWLNRFRGLTLGSAVALTAVAVAVYSPWPIRNSLLLGQFIPGSSEATEWFWRGTNPNATGSSWTADGRTMFSVASRDFQARIAAASEGERIVIYRNAAVQYVASHPLDAGRIYLLKLKGFWWGSATTGFNYPSSWPALYRAWYATVLLFSSAGVWRSWRDTAARSVIILILGTLISVSVMQALFYVEGRHRLAIEPLLLVLAGVGFARIRNGIRESKIGGGLSRTSSISPRLNKRSDPNGSSVDSEPHRS